MAIKVGALDIQFGREFDQTKANLLVQSLQQVISAIRTLSAASSTPLPPGPPSVAQHELADETGLGPYHTVSGLQAGQTLVATSPTSAYFDFLEFGELANTDPGSFNSPAEGDIIAFQGGLWSAVTAINGLIGLVDPGGDALIMWDPLANGGTGGLTWATAGPGITLTSGSISATSAVVSMAASDAMAFFTGL